jgi:GTP cyclohydrolase I
VLNENASAAAAQNVIGLRELLDRHSLIGIAVGQARPRRIASEDWRRFEDNVAEIFTAFGMDLETPGTTDTPQRFLRALFDATAGYEGDPKLLTAFPTEFRSSPDSVQGQIVEGPISFSALCEHHSLPFFGCAHVGMWPGSRSSGSRS